MDEKELREIEELESALTIIYGDDDETEIDWYSTARANYENGIRKVPEDAIVLTKKEYWDLLDATIPSTIDKLVIVEKTTERVRNHLSKVIYDKIKEKIYKRWNEDPLDLYLSILEEICDVIKEYNPELIGE